MGDETAAMPGLTILGAADPRSPDDVAAALAAIEPNVAQLRVWHRFSAVNHDHRVMLVDAEIARVSGDDRAAAELYDRAGADVAERHWTRACELYARWGATAKVAHLAAERAGAAVS